MPYPTEQELLDSSNPPRWIDQHFLRQDPYAFEMAGVSFHEVACQLAADLPAERNGIFCVGSGAVGLSVNPNKVTSGHLKVFGPDSDLDLAIVSWHHFELAWRELLRSTQPHLREVPKEVEEHLKWQKKRIFDGAILANKLLGSLSFGHHWRGVIDKVSGPLADALDRNVDVRIWIYRDYWSLRNYISRGIVDSQKTVKIGG